MNAITKTVEAALQEASKLMTIDEIRAATDLEDSVVRAELRQLAKSGQIEHVPGRGRYDARYGLLQPIAKATDKESLTVQAVGADSEGSKAGIKPATQAPRTLRLTAAAQADREDFESKFGNDGNCSCHISAPCRSCTHPGNPIQQDADECWEPDEEDGAHQIPAPEYDPNSVAFSHPRSPTDTEMSLLNVITDIRAAVGDKTGKIMLGDLAAHIGKIYQLGEAHREACMGWERAMMQAIGEDGIESVVEAVAKLNTEHANAVALTAKLEHLLGVERQTSSALREQLDHANHGIIDSYCVVAPKRPIRRFTAHGSAVKSALAAASNGSGRGEVFGLVLLGAAKRGAVYREAGK